MPNKCDIDGCKETATYEAKLKLGPWAFVCNYHFETMGVGIKGSYTELQED